jgi:chlorophyll synthase
LPLRISFPRVCLPYHFFVYQIRLQLTKPGTWIPLIWGVACGAAASGNYHAVWNLFGEAPTTDSWGLVAEDTCKALAAMFLSGPLLTGYTQVWSSAARGTL